MSSIIQNVSDHIGISYFLQTKPKKKENKSVIDNIDDHIGISRIINIFNANGYNLAITQNTIKK